MAGHLALPSVLATVIIAGLSDPARGAVPSVAKKDESTSATIIVELTDQASLPAQTLTQAKRQVSRMYGDIGVEVVWTDAPANDARGRFVVHLMVRTKPPRPRMMGNALGDSHDTGGTAFVYRDRVLGVARARNLDVATLFAYAMAHEIGHLLLPAPSHAIAGIMNADWDGADFRNMAADALRFTSAQANAIRARASVSGGVAAQRER